MFEKEEVAEYYNTTQNHYEKWWSLKQHLSLHYGIWDETTRTHGDALQNTNRILITTAGIKPTDLVLDAGCGVGGAAFFIHQKTGATVTGISLSDKQIALAKKMTIEKGISQKVSFQLMDFINTSFPDEHFDVVWCCEAMCHAQDKSAFIKECFRVLKPGGRLVISDYFLPQKEVEDKNNWLKKWCDTWAMHSFDTMDVFKNKLLQSGFDKADHHDYSSQIRKSAKRMYYAALLGATSSEVYNFFHPRVSRFAKTHYKSGYYQYNALKEGLWKYNVVMAIK